MKKFFLLAIFFLGVSVLFHQEILGNAAKFILKKKLDVELSYRTVAWENGKVVFSDLVLFDHTFCAHIDRASMHFDWKSLPRKLKGHLQLDDPHISVFERREMPSFKNSWLDLSVNIERGTAEWEGLVHFTLQHNAAYSHIALDWKDSSLELTRSKGFFDAELSNFHASLLQSFVPYVQIADGQLQGRVAFKETLEPLSASLKVTNLGLALSEETIDSVEGTLSYNAALGAKWELCGLGKAQGKQFPFTWEGRGFFNSGWLETRFDFLDATCQITKDTDWTLECKGLGSEQLALVQAGAVLFASELGKWKVQNGLFDAKAVISAHSWSAEFQGEHFTVEKGDFSLDCDLAKGNLTQDGGDFQVTGDDFDLQIVGTWEQWKAQSRFQNLQLAFQGGWDGEKFPIQIERGCFDDFLFAGKGWCDLNLDFSLNLDGQWTFLEKELSFSCPLISKLGSTWSFDFRLTRPTWDIFRLVATSDGKEICYGERSHFLGAPLHFESTDLKNIDLCLQLPWKSVQSLEPVFANWGFDLSKIPPIANTDIHFKYIDQKLCFFAKGSDPQFSFAASHENGSWKFDLQSELSLHALLNHDGITKGTAKWAGAEVDFEGRITPSMKADLSLTRVLFDLALLKDPKIEGMLEGQGHFIYNKEIEADFDVLASALKIQSHALENAGSIHLNYSSKKGMLFRGLDLHGPFDCIIDLLRYDAHRKHWIFHGAQVHLPGSFLTHKLLQMLDKRHDLNFTADLDFASDFSQFTCMMREAYIPYEGVSHLIEDLHLQFDRGSCDATFRYNNHLLTTNVNIDEQITGKLSLGEDQNPLTIDWDFADTLQIHSVEGSFHGLEASFHEEGPNTLIGSARINFTAVSPLLPKDVAQVFEKIKMGKGYELKGRLKLNKYLPSFQGILTGKHLELFGFQFRTLLAQVDLSAEKIRIADVKISDSAGSMKIDEILIAGFENEPWTIRIPTLSIHEMRPSLMQRPNEELGPISPLVVRELKMVDFQGFLEDSTTYTATGTLHFINSYKREETVFDLPANLLSRIVGLDLELLIPVTGDLDFELEDGFFNLVELKNAYSEGNRSEFFLEMDPPPKMDLDGNLQIFIKMKQFVLLKITESFLISISGQIDEPEFHLQKRRFFGLI